MDEVVIRPRWYRNLPLMACVASVLLLLGVALDLTSTFMWSWLVVALYAFMVVFWARAAVQTCIRCDGQGLRSKRPLAKLTASVSWDEVGRFFRSDRGGVKAEMRDGEPVVVLDPSGDGRWIATRLEDERLRRQRVPPT